MTYVSFIIRRNGAKIRRIAGVKTPDEALEKFARLTRNNVDDLKAKGYTAEEVPADTPEEMHAKNVARHSKWFHGRSGASKVADRLVRQAQRRGESTPASVVNSLLEDCGEPGCEEIPSLQGKGIEVTRLSDGPNGFRRFQVMQQSGGGMEDDHWIANQISWHYGAKNQFTVGDRKGNTFVVHIPPPSK